MDTRQRRNQSKKLNDKEGTLNASQSTMATPVSTASASAVASMVTPLTNEVVSPPLQSTEQSPGIDKSTTGSTKREKFEESVMKSLQTIIDGQLKLRNDMEAFKTDITKSVEYQGLEIKDLQDKTKMIDEDITGVKTKVDNACDRIFQHRKHISDVFYEVNRVERSTRRNNIRIIGYPEHPGENIIAIVDDILISKFGFEQGNVEIERAHRDGKPYRGKGTPRPRHILIKLLRFRDKVIILQSWRQALKGESFRVAEDLTKIDLEEKQRWSQDVQELYKRGVKLRFTGGMWRDRQGKLAPFYQRSPEPGGEVGLDESESLFDTKYK